MKKSIWKNPDLYGMSAFLGSFAYFLSAGVDIESLYNTMQGIFGDKLNPIKDVKEFSWVICFMLSLAKSIIVMLATEYGSRAVLTHYGLYDHKTAIKEMKEEQKRNKRQLEPASEYFRKLREKGKGSLSGLVFSIERYRGRCKVAKIDGRYSDELYYRCKMLQTEPRSTIALSDVIISSVRAGDYDMLLESLRYFSEIYKNINRSPMPMGWLISGSLPLDRIFYSMINKPVSPFAKDIAMAAMALARKSPGRKVKWEELLDSTAGRKEIELRMLYSILLHSFDEKDAGAQFKTTLEKILADKDTRFEQIPSSNNLVYLLDIGEFLKSTVVVVKGRARTLQRELYAGRVAGKFMPGNVVKYPAELIVSDNSTYLISIRECGVMLEKKLSECSREEKVRIIKDVTKNLIVPLHRIKPEDFEAQIMLDFNEEMQRRIGYFFEHAGMSETAGVAEYVLQKLGGNTCLIHGDIFRNVLFTARNPMLLDFEYAMQGNRCIDLADIIANPYTQILPKEQEYQDIVKYYEFLAPADRPLQQTYFTNLLSGMWQAAGYKERRDFSTGFDFYRKNIQQLLAILDAGELAPVSQGLERICESAPRSTW